MKSLGTIVLILALAAVGLVLWPAPNPLAGIETVAIEDNPGPLSELINGSQITLGNNEIRLVNNASDADAVITFIEVKGGSGSFELSSESGLRVESHFVLEVEKNGERSLMDLYVRLENGDFTTQLVGRKFYEVWK